MNKSLSFLVYAGIWFLMVLVQTFMISSSGDTPSVFVTPEVYYSTWLIDLFLILLYYFNYYVLVPKMIRRRLFLPYAGTVVVASLIGFLLPIVLYVGLQWTMPGTPVGTAPTSSFGVLGAIATMSIGLAIRSIFEWIQLEEKLKICQADLENMRSIANNQDLELHEVRSKSPMSEKNPEIALQSEEISLKS